MAGRKTLTVEVVGDDKSYLRMAERDIATNTKLAGSWKTVGISAEKAAILQVNATVKSQAAQKARIAATQRLAFTATTPAVKEAAFASAAKQQAALDKQLGNVTKSTRASALSTVALGSAQSRTATETAALSAKTAVAERDLNKVVRGGLAGAGVFKTLGRSLAFASSGFIAFAIGAGFIRKSIDAAVELQATEKQVNKQLEVGGASWKRYGDRINAVSLRLTHVAGFTRVDLLQAFTGLFRVTNNVGQALHLESVAADVARGRHITLTAASNALAKAAGGSFSALRRLNIIIPQGFTKMQALAFVQQKYAGQAAAGTTAQERFSATLVASEEIIGTALLPTVTHLLTKGGDWLAQMNESGKLQKDINHWVSIGGDAFHTLEGAIAGVDRVTGSFANTLKLIIGLKFASLVAGWITSLKTVATAWGTVTASAETATAAQETALGAGAIAGGALGGAAGGAAFSSKEAAATNAAIQKSLGREVATASETGLATGVVAGATVAAGRLGGLKAALSKVWVIPVVLSVVVHRSSKGQKFLDQLGLGFLGHVPLLGGTDQQIAHIIQRVTGAKPPAPISSDTTFSFGGQRLVAGTFEAFQTLTRAGAALGDISTVTAKQEIKAAKELDKGAKTSAAVAKRVRGAIILLEHDRAQLEANTPQNAVVGPFLRRGIIPAPFRLPGPLGAALPGFGFPPPKSAGPPRNPFGNAQPLKLWANFALTLNEQIAQAQAAITKTTKDDVAAAKQVVARIKRGIEHGHLDGKQLLAALGLEASALQTIWSAEAQAAQDRATKAQAAKARIQAAIENSIDPIKLEVALSRAELTGDTGKVVRALKALRASAQKALNSGKLSAQQQQEALQQIISLNQQIKDAAQNTTIQFQVPARLALALARDTALGRDTTKDLLRIKRALLKFISSHRKNLAALTDAYNQLAAINSQLGQSASSALGLFKQASTKALTAGLGLTAAQRKALRQRLAGLGPGQTVSGTGVGAGGFAIDPNTGRPIALDRRNRRPGQQDGGPRRPQVVKVQNVIDLNVEIDGHHVEATVTKRQQKRRRQNPRQRRGPNAGG